MEELNFYILNILMVRNSDMDRAGPEKDYLRSRTQTQAGIPVKQCLKLSCLNEN